MIRTEYKNNNNPTRNVDALYKYLCEQLQHNTDFDDSIELVTDHWMLEVFKSHGSVQLLPPSPADKELSKATPVLNYAGKVFIGGLQLSVFVEF